MAGKNLKEIVSSFSKNEKVASFIGVARENLSTLFSTKPSGFKDMVGLDIDPARIKLLKINSSVTPYEVESYASAPLPAGVIVKDEIKDAAAIGNVVRDTLKQAGITAKFAAVAIPRTLAIIKNITIDKRLNADEIEQRAWIEANRQFPDLIGNIYLDFTIVGPSLQVPDQLELLLVACRKEHIKPYFDILQTSGLQPRIVDVDCYALERAMTLALTKEINLDTCALLNINVSQSSLIVVHKKQLIHAHDQSYDGQRLIKQVEEFVKKKHAEPGMENASIAIDDPAYNTLLQENFISHLRQIVHFFYSSKPNINIEKIILSGDCMVIPDFASFIQKETGIPAVLAQPFQEMSIGSHLNANELQHSAPSLVLCSGLALSGAEAK